MKVRKYSKKFLLVLYYHKICQFYFIRKKSQCVILCAKLDIIYVFFNNRNLLFTLVYSNNHVKDVTYLKKNVQSILF